jgi:hypothetical protein
MIGNTGGSIASADGNAELIFLMGALADNTNISVQATQNRTNLQAMRTNFAGRNKIPAAGYLKISLYCR